MSSKFEELAANYYQHVPAPELATRSGQDLLARVASHAELAQTRSSGEILVRVDTSKPTTSGGDAVGSHVQVVVDDTPFVVDSLLAELEQTGQRVSLLAHPQWRVRRDSAGRLESVGDGPLPESWVHIELGAPLDAAQSAALAERLRLVLTDVGSAVTDWTAMADRAGAIAAQHDGQPQRLLDWLIADNFLFLGCRDYAIDPDDPTRLAPIASSGLGILRDPLAEPNPSAPLTNAESAPGAVRIWKSRRRSRVHRSAQLDCINVAMLDADGRMVGEHLIVGLFTAQAYNASVAAIDFLADKLAEIRTRSGYASGGHAERDLTSVLETYPRDELIQADVAFLTQAATTVVAARRTQEPLLFVRSDELGGYLSVVVFLPRGRYDAQARSRIEAVLHEQFPGSSIEHSVRISAAPLAMAHFVVRAPDRELPAAVSATALQDTVRAALRHWDDDWGAAMVAQFGPARAPRLIEAWASGLDEAYRATYSGAQAALDIQHWESVQPGDIEALLYATEDDSATMRRLRLYLDRQVGLTEVFPRLLDFGLVVTDERIYQATRADGTTGHLLDFGLAAGAEYWTDENADRFVQAFTAVWQGRIESDRFNQLIGAALSWQQILILRMVGAYLKQTTPYSLAHLQEAMTSQPAIARDLVDVFEARFDPAGGDDDRDAREQRAADAVLAGLAQVESLDHDRIIRNYLSVIRGAVRTNFYTADEPPTVLALKLLARELSYLPLPRPEFETWVYAPSVEGVHLRFGQVARGGLRWSSRREDFRTEVLGLVKAQLVKNSVIVPTGAKGCFFPKRLPNPGLDRAGWLAEGRRAYRDFVTALLSVTDNLVAGQVVPPARVLRHDGDDSYLVVAADKGTAAFSDLANEVAQQQGFWLDDAFASGGSTGYDHKAMGITARGAWRSVIRHFAELGVDPEREEITAVGIGDMSGDVFGNGLLRSRTVRLVAAFDHRHIFIDPDPDAAVSFTERQRLFELPGSSWADYASELISAGGGAFARSAKSIPLTPQIRELLPTLQDRTEATPVEVIRAILQAPVDLLWNGGVGTYVKASTETQQQVGDPSNDALRIDGRDLACRVVGEGGNLGFTQLGRIEAARAGVHINTDAIDNSGGVDSSDHEVNIKILLNRVVADGQLTISERNELLAQMTDEVAERVLRTNYEQNVLLGNARYLAEAMLAPQERLMQILEARGVLDREIEALPSVDELRRRARDGKGLTSPEFAVLVVYAKLALTEDLLASQVIDDPWFERLLTSYFPVPLQGLAEAIQAHPLRREIIATRLANLVVNRGGITFVSRAMDETGASAPQIAQALAVLAEVFGMADYLAQIEALDGRVPTALQSELYLDYRRMLDLGARQLLGRGQPLGEMTAEIERYREPVGAVLGELNDLLGTQARDRLADRVSALVERGLPSRLAEQTARHQHAVAALELADQVRNTGADLRAAAQIYFRLAERLQFETVFALLASQAGERHWDAAARAMLHRDLYRLVGNTTARVLADAAGGTDEAVVGWVHDRAPGLASFDELVSQLRGEQELGLGQGWVLMRQAQSLLA